MKQHRWRTYGIALVLLLVSLTTVALARGGLQGGEHSIAFGKPVWAGQGSGVAMASGASPSAPRAVDAPGPADWPMRRYSAGKSNANAEEQELIPPLAQNTTSTFIPELPFYTGFDSHVPLLVVGETGYGVFRGENGPSVRAYDLANVQANAAQLVWEYGNDEAIIVLIDLAISGDVALVRESRADGSVSVVALDRTTGAVEWRRGSIWGTFTVDGDRVFAQTKEGFNVGDPEYLVALDRDTGQELWKREFIEQFLFAADDGRVVLSHLPSLVSAAPELVAVDQTDGSVLWRNDGLPGNDLSQVHTLLHGGIFVYQDAEGITGLDAQDGSVLWERAGCPGDEELLRPDIGAAGQQVVLVGLCQDGDGVTDNFARSLDVSTGVEQWTKPATFSPYSQSTRPLAMGNGVLYTVESVDPGVFSPLFLLRARSLADGSELQAIEAEDTSRDLLELTVANGRLLGTGWIGTTPLVFVWEPHDDRYLDRYDQDDLAHTNPLTGTTVSLIEREGSYGARISVGVEEMTQTVTLRVYNADGSVYKEASGVPDRHGNAYWEVPVAYASAGYSYDVELPGGKRLPRRPIEMPASPATSVVAVQDLDGLQWVSPPDVVSNVPTTLRLQLPGDFPDGATDALLNLSSTSQGGTFIPGVRSGDTVEFVVDKNNVALGSFAVEAVATAAAAGTGDYTAYSSQRIMAFTAPSLPEVLPGYSFAMRSDGTGEVELVTHRFQRERDREPSDVDAQIADIVVLPGGARVVVQGDTPREDPEDPRTKERPVRVTGYDDQGNPVSSKIIDFPAGSEDVQIPVGLPQSGARPIRSIGVEAASLPPLPEGEPPPPPRPDPPSCNGPTNPPPPEDDDGDGEPKQREWLSMDRVHITSDSGVSAEATYGLGVTGALYSQADAAQGIVQNCGEIGLSAGVGAEIGPMKAIGAAYDLPGPGFDAPATSGRKIGLSAEVGVGVEMSFTIPDNWETADSLGSIGIGISGAPGAGVAGSVKKVWCEPVEDPGGEASRDRSRCCPTCPPPPPQPGGDHPDDTLSPVIRNLTSQESELEQFWAGLARNARYHGFGELARYADHNVRLAGYAAEINGFPTGTGLTQEQQTVIQDFLAYAAIDAVQMEDLLPAALEQWRLLKDQGSAQVLTSGYYPETLQMLSDYGIPAETVGPNLSPRELGDGLLIIPTGGLSGIADVEAFRDRLQEFVLNGGTLLVMSQPEDDSLAALPGAGLSQVGYNTDISCYEAAMSMLAFHPILASRAQVEMTSHVDGYLTSWPSVVTPLMERTKNEQGALLLYPYGEGRMIVTNMYDDWGRTVAQSSLDVRRLFHDVIRWGMQPGDLPDASPGGSVTVALEVRNQTESDAASVRYVVRDPTGGRVPLTPAEEDVTLGAGRTTTLQPTFSSLPASLGIWQLNYELLDGAGAVVQQESTGSLFAVSDPPLLVSGDGIGAATGEAGSADAEAEPTGAALQAATSVSVALDQDSYQTGETVGITVSVGLSDPSGVSDLKVVVSMGETTEQQVVPAQASQQVSFSLPADFSGNGLLFYGVYDDGTDQGLHLDTLWVQEGGAHITVTPDRPRYAPGETVELTIQSDAARSVDLLGAGIDRQVSVPAGTTTESFTLPATLARGGYAVRAAADVETVHARFDVDGPEIVIRALETSAPIATAGVTIPITAHVESDSALDVTVLGTLVEPDGDQVRILEERHTLGVGSQTISWRVPFSTTMAGLSRLDLTMLDYEDPTVAYVETTRRIATDSPQLLAVRPLSTTIEAGVVSSLALDWYSPDAGTVDVALLIDGAEAARRQVSVGAGFTTTTVSLPAVRSRGTYDLVALATVEGLQTAADAMLTVREPSTFRIVLPLVLRDE